MRSAAIRQYLALIAVAALTLVAGRAAAQTPPPISHFADGGIEIDGNYLDSAATPGLDWFPGFPPFSDPIRQDDHTLCGTSPAPKNDLTNTYVANDFDYLYVGMERLANHGNTSFFFTFDITGDGPSVGDFIFVFCFGNGSAVSDTYVLEYDARRGDFVRDSTPPHVDFAVNTTRILSPFGALDRHGRPSTSIEAGEFAEARIALADIEGFDVCAADDVTLEIQTKSSCSLSSQCKDTSGPLSFSFTPLAADLELAQSPGCAPEIVATAHASSPRHAAVISYRWFVEGVEITGNDPTYATSDRIVIPLAGQCGPTEVRVVVDDGTCLVEDAASVDVNRPPAATIGQASVAACDGRLTYSGAGSADCNGSTLAFAWDFNGDGVVDSTLPSGTYLYAGCGDRAISLVVSDGTCTSPPAGAVVHVNAAPEAGLVVTPSAAGCLEIAFTVTSTDCDLATPSSSYTEILQSVTDFGDGTPTSAAASGVHAYAQCGTFDVTTTTTDASGCSDSVSHQVILSVVGQVD